MLFLEMKHPVRLSAEIHTLPIVCFSMVSGFNSFDYVILKLAHSG